MVSVIIPNYNHARFLKQRIESVLSQTYQDFELILMDDCSRDGSRDILNSYRAHPKVSHIIFNDVNSGSTFKQWKKGIEHSQGDWIWIAESDDYADSTLLSELVDRVGQDRNLVIAYSQSYQVDEEGGILRDLNFHTDPLDEFHWKADYTNEGLREIKQYLLYKNTIPNASAVIFKKSAYLEADKSFENMRLCGDWMLWVQLLKKGSLAFCSKPLNFFRTHGATTRVLDNTEKLKLRAKEEHAIALDICQLKGFEKNKNCEQRLHELADQYGAYSGGKVLHYLVNVLPLFRDSYLHKFLKQLRGVMYHKFLRGKKV